MASFEIKRRNGDTYTVLVDDSDLPRVLAAGPWAVFSGPRNRTMYVVRQAKEPRRTEYLHRLLLVPDKGVQVDHIDCNGLNNQRANLRLCTPSQNHGNVAKYTNNTAGFKGVSWDKNRRKWVASIRAQGKTRPLGRFDSAEEAHAAYCKAAADLFESFARFK